MIKYDPCNDNGMFMSDPLYKLTTSLAECKEFEVSGYTKDVTVHSVKRSSKLDFKYYEQSYSNSKYSHSLLESVIVHRIDNPGHPSNLDENHLGEIRYMYEDANEIYHQLPVPEFIPDNLVLEMGELTKYSDDSEVDLLNYLMNHNFSLYSENGFLYLANESILCGPKDQITVFLKKPWIIADWKLYIVDEEFQESLIDELQKIIDRYELKHQLLGLRSRIGRYIPY